MAGDVPLGLKTSSKPQTNWSCALSEADLVTSAHELPEFSPANTIVSPTLLAHRSTMGGFTIGPESDHWQPLSVADSPH